ncbi:hypothetical protein CRE_21963 [Caenorhabditis remanei]|uniref:F-box domain-containing protein n=1 Tax=Caenorhabditis remanei TaxID=31234 RepID=E3N3C1_CAERE|nr:hypothetical protein CRE_21963 [Caenorhabditis remanei]
MPPLPLLRLPELVLCEVFKSLSIREKILLSLCSKKISTQINNAQFYSQKVIVDLDMLYQGIRVHTENNRDSFEIYICPDSMIRRNLNTRQFFVECCIVRTIFIPTGISTFWKNHQEGFPSMIRHLSKMFQCKISTKSSCNESDLFQETISNSCDLQLEFKKLATRLNGSKDQNLFWYQISSNLELVESLCISSVPDPGFSPVFTSWPQNIFIGNFDWFTVEYLLACTCTTITLEDSSLENKDLEEILKIWKAGGFPNLERLKIHSRNITSTGTTILGMNSEELYKKDIETEDGSKKAFIRIRHQVLEMSVTPLE